VPAELLGGLDGDEPARGYIREQDREISESWSERAWPTPTEDRPCELTIST
jgi:hypothetical protein